MLSVLRIQNIAIIESAEIEFSRGFNVLTGETGAGKSIILDSIGAVLGFRTSRELIRTGEKEAQVSALFVCVNDAAVQKLKELSLPLGDDNSILITRTIGADKNICRVNNALTTVAVLRELGASLINIHGQQDNRELLNSEAHLGFVDAVSSNSALKDDFSEKYEKLCIIEREIKRLSADKSEKARKIDILSFQIDELKKANITPGELDSLKARRDEMLNFEKIQSAFSSARDALSGGDEFSGAVSLVSGSINELSSVSSVSTEANELSKSLSDLYYELSDIAETISGKLKEADFSQSELEAADERIDLIYRLSKKYGDTEEAMLSFLEDAENELEEITFSDEKLEKLCAEREKLYDVGMAAAKKLSDERKATAERFSAEICSELRFLDMPYVQFFVKFNEALLSENGIDEAEFYISANVGEAPKPLAKIASGGELSRIMLSIKNVLSDKDKTETMIFDEIDAGVSGNAAVKVAKKLKEVSNGKQVICVTHLSQLAAFSDNHYLIEKKVMDNKTYTSVTPLDFEGRKREIARITGNGEITETQLKNAEEILLAAEKG